MEEKYEPKNACEKIVLFCDRMQYEEIGFLPRIKLHLHLFLCSPCRNYSKKNVQLTKTIEKSNISCLNSQEREGIKQLLKEKSSQ